MRRASSLISLVCLVIFASGCKSGTAGKVVTISVAPTGINVVVGTTQQFTATVTQTFNTGVTWSVAGGSANGTISSSGLYAAPASVPNPALVTIRATSQKDTTKSGSATVTVTTTPVSSNVSVVVSPGTASVPNFGTQQFTATVSGSTNTAVAWKVNGTTGGSRQFGFISSSGLYVAPSGVPTASKGGDSVATTLTVAAVSQADSTASDTAVVTVVPANQSAQTGAVTLGSSGGSANDSHTAGGTITCCGGTLGALVTRGGTQFVLSNNHVLARSDLGTATNGATPGDAVLEPGLIDASCQAGNATTVANLTQFANLEVNQDGAGHFHPPVDAAIAEVVSGQVDSGGSILYLGATADSNGVPVADAPHAGSGVAPTMGRKVAKSGRSTGLTCSTIQTVSTTTSVQYQKGCGTGSLFTAIYSDEVSFAGGDFSAQGDSGSLIVTQDTADPVALLFAGSDSNSVGNPVGDVLSFFASGGNNVTFVGGGTHQVIGCSLPNAPQSASKMVPAASLTAAAMRKAVAARDTHGPELLAHPEVQALGVGTSYDNPDEPAILFFVTRGLARTNIPLQVDGVRTRIVEGDLFAHRGTISAAESVLNEQSVAAPQAVYAISDAEVARAKVIHTAHVDEMMKQPGVQGFGVTSSVDSPGEAALMIFLIRGVAHDAIPPVMDGLRTRVRESSRFKAGTSGDERHPACSLPSPKMISNGSGVPARAKH